MTNGPRTGISEMQRAVGRIEGKMDAFIEQMRIHDERSAKLETRVRAIERWQHFYSGAGAILGALLGAFGVHMRSG
jgi:hypothetical protein